VGVGPKPKLLSKKEYEAVLDHMRHWPLGYRDVVAKLVKHAQALKWALDNTEADLAAFKQADFFRKQAELKATPASPPVRPSPVAKYPLWQRLYDMDRAGQRGSPEWERTLKWNRITEAQATALIEAEKKIE